MSWFETANTVAEAFREVFDLVRRDRCRFETGKDEDQVRYYFRGLNKNFEDDESSFPPSKPAIPTLYRFNSYIEASFLKLSISDALALKCGRQKIRVFCENPFNPVFEVWEKI